MNPIVEAEPLPRLYQRWVTAFLAGPVPRERKATCDDCAMAKESEPMKATVRFLPNVKCCTFVPELPNFLAGLALADADPAAAAGRETIERRIDARAGITPLGVAAKPSYTQLFDAAGPAAFGRSPDLLCPHYLSDSGRCAIWNYRNSTCATWFCKHNRGSVGLEFWDALKGLLRCVEQRLAWWCVVELIDDPIVLGEIIRRAKTPASSQVADELIRTDDRSKEQALWGSWHGREREWFQQCGRRVDQLEWPAVIAIAGAEGVAHLRSVEDGFARLTDFSLPDRLRLASKAARLPGHKVVPIAIHSPTDMISVPGFLLPALAEFNGRPTSEVVSGLEAQGTSLPQDLLRRLVDYGVLEKVD